MIDGVVTNYILPSVYLRSAVVCISRYTGHVYETLFSYDKCNWLVLRIMITHLRDEQSLISITNCMPVI